MEKIIKGFLKVLLFLLILLGIFIYLSYVFAPKDTGISSGIHDYRANGILAEKDNTIDVLIAGDSEAYTFVIPTEIYAKYGITSYVIGTPNQPLYYTNYFINRTLKKQDIKLLVLESSVFFSEQQKKKELFFNLKIGLPIFNYHSRWKEIGINDFFEKISYNTRELEKGSYLENDIVAGLDREIIKTEDVAYISDANLKSIDKIINLAKNKKIDVLLVSSPTTVHWNYSKHNAVSNLAKKYNLDYIDMNLIPEIGIDWSHDSMDGGSHLNFYGASKVSNYLGKYLNSLGYLDDRRDNPDYLTWDEDLKKYNEFVKNNF